MDAAPSYKTGGSSEGKRTRVKTRVLVNEQKQTISREGRVSFFASKAEQVAAKSKEVQQREEYLEREGKWWVERPGREGLKSNPRDRALPSKEEASKRGGGEKFSDSNIPGQNLQALEKRCASNEKK